MVGIPTVLTSFQKIENLFKKSVIQEKSNHKKEIKTNWKYLGNAAADKYNCVYNDCGKCYKSSNALKTNKEIHSGVRYLCRWPSCKYETNRKSNLKNQF